MPRGRTLSLSFPPFTYWIKRIIIACVAVYFLQVILGAFVPSTEYYLRLFFALIPDRVLHGWIWQLVTYSFLHAGVMHVLINMLMLWMFGAQEEMDWGSKKFLEFYLFCIVGAALTTMVVAYSPIPGVSPLTATIGASGGVYGVLMAFGMLYGDQEIFMFPLPFMMKAKYMVAIMILLVILATFQPSQGGIANFAHLGGLLFGFLYVKFMPRRGLTYGASERYFNIRNAYYRWKRRRAARKFEVYMRQHNRTVSFDEHGNYIPPDEMDKKNGGSKSGWVN
ncbi:MAG TPA: rhomboid family intramembrane serine protease [Terriglobales bacterium]|nr:rhomboid family intramembrane serine protease [Terriglobales bacterium]